MYSGVGAYVGFSPTLRFFLLGVNDHEPAFNIVGTIARARGYRPWRRVDAAEGIRPAP